MKVIDFCFKFKILVNLFKRILTRWCFINRSLIASFQLQHQISSMSYHIVTQYAQALKISAQLENWNMSKFTLQDLITDPQTDSGTGQTIQKLAKTCLQKMAVQCNLKTNQLFVEFNSPICFFLATFDLIKHRSRQVNCRDWG